MKPIQFRGKETMSYNKTEPQMNSHPDEIKWNGVDYVKKDFVNQEAEKRIAEIVREAWFEGMKQGITFTREDRDRELRTSKRMTFDEWLRSRLSQKTDNLKENNNNGSTN